MDGLKIVSRTIFKQYLLKYNCMGHVSEYQVSVLPPRPSSSSTNSTRLYPGLMGSGARRWIAHGAAFVYFVSMYGYIRTDSVTTRYWLRIIVHSPLLFINCVIFYLVATCMAKVYGLNMKENEEYDLNGSVDSSD